MLIDEKYCQGQTTHFVISGGEPTINPALMDWVKFLYSLGHRVSMHSNGSRNTSYYLELIEFTNLNISVHFDFYRPQRLLKTLHEITQKKIATRNRGVGHLEVKLMMPPDKVDEALTFEQEMRKIPEFKNFSTWAIVPIREGDFGELLADGYKESDFALFGDRV
jgi:organic radical activating enzyme